jgi:hypothetical protein
MHYGSASHRKPGGEVMPQYLVALGHPDGHDPSVETQAMAMVRASERRRKDNSR